MKNLATYIYEELKAQDYIYAGNSIRLDESSNSPEKMLQQRLEVIKLPKIKPLQTNLISTLEEFIEEIKKFENKEISEEQFVFDLCVRTLKIVPKENQHDYGSAEVSGPSASGNSGTYWYENTIDLDLGSYTLRCNMMFTKRWTSHGATYGRYRKYTYTLYKGNINNKNKKEIYSLKPGTKYEKKYCYWDIITSMCKD